jgi:hypothetical protein
VYCVAIRLLAAIAIITALALRAAAHEIPNDVKINAFVKPAGNTLTLLMRVPLAAMIEVDFPKRGAGYLVISRADDALRHAVKLYLTDNITITENDAPLPPPRVLYARVSLPSDRSFTSYDAARAHVASPPLADDLDLYWNQQLLDVLLEYPIRSDRSEFAVRFKFDRLGRNVSTALRFLPPGGATRAFEFHGDPGLIALDPSWYQAACRFVASGFWHILEGTDHLLFLVCLVIPFRRLKPLVIIVTSFTVAHSIALIASALDFVPDALWFPPLVETLIAVTIVYMAIENIVYAALDKDPSGEITRRWVIAFAFGIVHGFGFSFALKETLQFAGDHLLTSLLAFNVGVEIGQIAVLLVLLPIVGLIFRHLVPIQPGLARVAHDDAQVGQARLAERLGVIMFSALVAHTAWHWMIERGEALAKFPFPTIDAAFLASAMRGLMAALVLGGGLWLASGLLRRWISDAADGAPAKGSPASGRSEGNLTSP